MTVQYVQKSGAVVPQRVDTVVISVQHDDGVSLEEQRTVLMEEVIKAVVPSKYLDEDTVYHLQPSGRFVIGGPQVKALDICPEGGDVPTVVPTEAKFEGHVFVTSGRCWGDGPEDHRGHLRRLGGPRGRGFLGEGLHKGGPLGRLRRTLGGQVFGAGQTVPEGPGAGEASLTFHCVRVCPKYVDMSRQGDRGG